MAHDERALGREARRHGELPELLERLVGARDERSERELAEEIACRGVAGMEERVLQAFPRIASARARETLRQALREAGHPAARPSPARVRSRARRARRLAASVCLGLGAAWLTVALLAGARGDWAAFAISTLVFFAVVAVLGSYLAHGRHPRGPGGSPGPTGEVAGGAAD